MRTSELTVPFEIKAATDDGRIEGYGAVFDNVDLGMDVIEKGAFADSLKSRNGKPLPMLWQHNHADPIGVWDGLSEDSKGLHVKGRISDTVLGRDARTLVKDGAVSGLSIGFYPLDYKYEEDVRVLSKLDVVEVSMATFPMNPAAQITAMKNLSNREFVQLARERMGLSREAAEALRANGFTGLKDYIGSRKSGDMNDTLMRLRNAIKDGTA